MNRKSIALPLSALALFCLYLYSAYPALSPYRDSGDMASAALTLGIAHPPGYPLYLLLAKAWLLLFRLGNAAFRLHVFSALAGAGTALLLGSALIREQRSLDAGRGGAPEDAASSGAITSSAIAAMLLLGLAPSFWHLALVSEMYSLNALVGAALLWLATRQGPFRRRRLYLAAMLLGLGLGNHQTLIAAAPGLALAFRPAEPEGDRWDWRLAASVAAFAALGLLLYAYLPLRSMADPVLDWGEPHRARNFLRMLTRADLGGIRLHPERAAGFAHPGQTLACAAYAVRLFAGELGWPGAALALWGAWTGRRRPATQGCLAAFLASGPLFVAWANLDTGSPETYSILEPHLVLPLVFAAALVGYGFADLCRRIQRAPAALPFHQLLPSALLLAVALAWLPTQYPGVRSRLRYRADFSAWDYGNGLLASLPPGALVLDPDDPTAFALSYLSTAHGRRRDVVPLLYFRTRWGYEQLRRRHPELLPPEEIRSGRELLWTLVTRAFSDGRPLCVDLPQKSPAGTEAVPAGLVYRLFRGSAPLDERLSLLHLSERLHSLSFARPSAPDADFFSRHTTAYWSSSLNNLGIQAQALDWTDASVSFYRRALALSPDLAEAWNNLANALLSRKDLGGAEGCYRLSLRAKPAAQVMYNLGRVYFLAGRMDKAEETFLRAVAAGGPPEARNDLGLVYLRTGRVQQAVDGWRSLLSDLPGYTLGYYNLALGYEKLGEREKAAQALRVYLELVPDPAEKRDAARWLDRLQKS